MNLVKQTRLPQIARRYEVTGDLAKGATIAIEYLGIAAVAGGALGWALIQLAL